MKVKQTKLYHENISLKPAGVNFLMWDKIWRLHLGTGDRPKSNRYKCEEGLIGNSNVINGKLFLLRFHAQN